MSRHKKALERDYATYMHRWKASGKPVATVQCPECEQRLEVTAIPSTDSVTTCHHCGGYFVKEVDNYGTAHVQHLPGVQP